MLLPVTDVANDRCSESKEGKGIHSEDFVKDG